MIADVPPLPANGLGEVAFAAYRASVGGVTYDGKPIPQWAELSPTIRLAWDVAANAVVLRWERGESPWRYG